MNDQLIIRDLDSIGHETCEETSEGRPYGFNTMNKKEKIKSERFVNKDNMGVTKKW